MVVFPGCTSVTYVVIKCDDTVLTSAAPGVFRPEIRLTRQSISDLRFYFLGLEDDVGHAVPLMATIPSYLTGSWCEHWMDLLGHQ
jgi:hypothetical protein